MCRFYTKKTAGLSPYIPGEQPKDKTYIKLNTNESPYPPSPKVKQALQDFDMSELRLYPDPDCISLRTEIAGQYHVEVKNVFVGNGSDEVLALAFQAFFEKDEEIKFPDISYSFYKVYAKMYDNRYELIQLNDDFTLPVEKMFYAKGGVIFPNPNAPTGIALALDEVEKIILHNPNKAVMVDEAYIDFGGQSAVELVKQYENLLVIQTFSKSRALAGMRVGYAIGSEALITGLERVKNSFNSYTVDRIAMKATIASMRDEDYNKKIQEKICTTRRWVMDKLIGMGYMVTDSKTNFIFIRNKKRRAEDLFRSLRDHGILVRHFNIARINDWLRVSIGTDEEMDKFFQVLCSLG